MAADQVDVDGFEPFDLPLVVPVGCQRVATCQRSLDVERGAGDTRCPVGSVDGFSGAEEGLRGHARPVRALAADEFPLDDGGPQPVLACNIGDVLTGRSRSDHDHVEVPVHHESSLWVIRPTGGFADCFPVILGVRMRDLLLPATDAGVIGQLAAVVAVWVIALWALRNRPDARLFAVGAGLVLLALIGVRALH